MSQRFFNVLISVSALILLAVACTTLGNFELGKEQSLVSKDDFKPVPREFRAAWIATVANINWPSEPGLPVDSQKVEAIRLLNLLDSLNMNAAIFQVRPQADAFYPSELEPWSYFLTGEQGKAPEPYYDPLQFWIDEAHKRGIELHAWLNPYRAHHPTGGPVTETSITQSQPEWSTKLANNTWWFIPTMKEAQDQTFQVIMDLVKRYDLDGIHFDDYFYPYPSYNEGADFPDDASWASYLSSGGKLSKSDWRRKAVNDLMQRVYNGIKEEKKEIKFGLSPFGIWRPGYPESIQGFDQYEGLYADAKLWLNEGWIDYFTPQLYWPINQIPQSYPVLLGWWAQENTKGRHLWPGVSIGRFEGEKRVDEVLNKVMINRAMLTESPGMVHWSIQPLVEDSALVQALLTGPYAEPAIVTSSPWLSKEKPGVAVNLQVEQRDSTLHLKWGRAAEKNEVFKWVIYSQYENSTYHQVIPATEQQAIVDLYKLPKAYGATEKIKLSALGISAVSKSGVEGDLISVPME